MEVVVCGGHGGLGEEVAIVFLEEGGKKRYSIRNFRSIPSK